MSPSRPADPAPSRPLACLPALLGLALALATALTPAFAQAPPETAASVVRAQEVLSAVDPGGELLVEGALVPRLVAGERVQGRLQVLAELAPLHRSAADLGLPEPGPAAMTVSVVAEVEGQEVLLGSETVETGDLLGVEYWLYEATFALPSSVPEVVVIVDEPQTGYWGGARIEVSEAALAVPGAATVSVGHVRWSLAGVAPVPQTRVAAGGQVAPGPTAGGSAPAPAPSRPSPPAPSAGTRPPFGRPPAGSPPTAGAAPPAPTERTVGSAVRLLPPRGKVLRGPTEFETLVSDPTVAKVAFQVDGREVATAEKAPFDARLTLAGPGTPQVVKAVALGGDGRRLGEDAVEVNRDRRPFRVRIARLRTVDGGAVEVETEVSVPTDGRLDRVEVYWNEALVETLTAPPFRARLEPETAGPSDYVRTVAILADGRQLEDVALMAAVGTVEELDVNLVELYVVATDRDGRPVKDLQAEELTVRQGREVQQIARLSYAEDVPLVLGLVIDTSGSMQFIMNETKQAASQFLISTVGEQDQAFLVDFDTLPRLRHPTTGRIPDLLASFRGLVADGYTALYDAMVFSLVEFSAGRGRKALVVLTDGDDYKSRFGPNRAIQYGLVTGVPIYVIALGEPRQLRGSSRYELEAIANKTAGRLYFAQTFEDLARAYAEINEELRSQYLVSYYTDRPLAPGELRDVRVDVKRRGVEARTVVSAE